jgi:biotin transporter BioY
MGRLPFWVLIGLLSGFLFVGFLTSEWHRLTSPDDPVQREFWTVNALLFGVLPAYFLGRAILTVTAELRSRRSRSRQQ